MSENFHDKAVKLDESFGQLTSRTNQNTEATVTGMSEDDKKHPLSDTLDLDFKSPSTNDAPEQKVSETVTPAQRIESDQIVAEDRLGHAKKVLDELEDSAEAFKRHAEQDVETHVHKDLQRAEIAAEEKENEYKNKLDELRVDIEKDPIGSLKDLGKCLLMIIGAFTVLKMIFKKL